MSMAFFSSGHSMYSTRPEPADGDQQRRQVPVADRVATAHVEDLAIAGVVCAGPQERVGRVVHVDEVAELAAVAVDLDGAALEGEADEPADETLAVVSNQLPRTVHVRQPQRAGTHAEHVVVDEVVVLAGRLVDAVDVGRPHEMRLVDRQGVGAPVDLPRAGEHDLGVLVEVPARLEQGQLAEAVDLEIRVRIAHAVDVTDLPGEVEDDLLPAHQFVASFRAGGCRPLLTRTRSAIA